MRKLHEASESGEAYSPAEEQFNRRRRTFGMVAAPLLFFAILLWPTPTLSPQAHRLAAILVMMIVLWMTEALPLAITALLGPTLAVVTGVTTARAVFAPFADPIIFLFIGSFILAEAMFVHKLDRRLAFTALSSRWVGHSGLRLMVVYALVGCVISMWMSNTATTAMMFPLGLAVLAELGRGRANDPDFRRFALTMMLTTSFAASIGGIATPVGTPPNLIGRRFLSELPGVDVSFAGWMALGLPIVFLTMAFLAVWMIVPAARRITLGDEARRAVTDEWKKLGPTTIGERNVIIAFAVTVALWVGPGLLQLGLGSDHDVVRRVNVVMPESVAALIGALLLFVMPISWRARQFTITWEEASRIDWGIILLFGGGIAMGQLAETTGLSTALGKLIAAQFPGAGEVGLTLVFTAVAVVMSEAASNTASANIVVPTAIAVSRAAGVSPLEPALGATLGASLGFMMPISTPPNAIVYSSGYIPIGAMMRHGIVLDLIGYVIIVAVVLTMGGLLK
ncbi:MAG TPA: DASS family sodium-coupled anion symporter [Vicinamibacterales bacterium]|nr:DASS family sodium-coupled anion symporter [Vicinamibacterales bacterium]